MLQKRKAFDLRLKSVSDAGEFSGYASVFDVVDSYRERVAPGAFTATLAARKAAGRKFPILFQHDHAQPIGTWTRLEEDNKGLYGEGQLWLDEAPTARIVQRGMADKAIDGLSIGYYEDTWSMDEKEGVRVLDVLALVEASVVITPANDAARIDTVKAKLAAGEQITLRELEATLRERGFSRSEAAAIAAGGFKTLVRREAVTASDTATGDLMQALSGFTLPKL